MSEWDPWARRLVLAVLTVGMACLAIRAVSSTLRGVVVEWGGRP